MKMARKTTRHAMTLVELLAATSLAVLLLTASFGVLGSLVAQRKALAGDGTESPWRKRLGEMLRWDLSNARRMCLRQKELRLVGYGGVDFDSAEATHRPTEIIYTIRSDGDRSWLFRREIHLDSDSLHNSRDELVAVGVTSIAVYDPERSDEQELDHLNEKLPNADAPPVYVPISNRVQVVLRGGDRRNAILDELVILQ